MSLRIRIDPMRCQKTEYCIQLAPTLFGRAADGGPTGVLSASPAPLHEGLARESEALCPTGAIVVEANPD